jgi:multidrug efflux pump
MTSVAFIAGSVPLLLGHGAGGEVRLATGITVFAGMLGVTIFGLFLTPVFYVALRKWVIGHGEEKGLQNMPNAPQLGDEIGEVH